MKKEETTITNYKRVFLVLGLSIGNFAPYTVLMVFSTQLYKQLKFDNLGFYILAVTSFATALMCLLSPGIVLSIGSKRSIVISSFGITLWVCAYVLPFMCNTTGVNDGICSKDFITVFLLSITFIGGNAFSLFMTAVFSYVTSWSNRADIPLLQSFFYATPVCGKVISTITFSLTMKSPHAQSVFFMCLTGVSLVFSILFIFLPTERQEEIVDEQEILIAKAKPSFKQVVLKKTGATLQLIFSKKMLLLLPFLIYLSFVKETKLGVLSVMLNDIMKGTDRFIINQRTGYIAICESVSSVFFGILMGKFIQLVGKRRAIYTNYFFGIFSSMFVVLIFNLRMPYGIVWYLAFINYALSLGLGLIIQYSLLATEFETKEVAFGAAVLLNSLSSTAVLNLYTLFDIHKFYVMAIAYVVIIFIGAVAFIQFPMKKLDEKLPLRF